MYRINANGDKDRLYRITAPGLQPGCTRQPCYKYIYESNPAFDDFKGIVDTAVSNSTIGFGSAVLGGAVGGCVGGAPAGGVGCIPGAIVGGLGGVVVGGIVAGAVIVNSWSSAEEMYADVQDVGIPTFIRSRVQGPPRSNR